MMILPILWCESYKTFESMRQRTFRKVHIADKEVSKKMGSIALRFTLVFVDDMLINHGHKHKKNDISNVGVRVRGRALSP